MARAASAATTSVVLVRCIWPTTDSSPHSCGPEPLVRSVAATDGRADRTRAPPRTATFAARPAWRLRLPGQARPRHLRGQGEVDPQAGDESLLEPHDLRHDRADRGDRRHPGTGRRD